MLLVHHGPTLAPGRVKHIHFKKESKYPLLLLSILPLCSQSLEMFQPLAMRADAWQAIPVCQRRFTWLPSRRLPLSPSAQSFPENAGLYGSSFTSTSVGSALHTSHPVLAEAEGSVCSLASRTPPHNSVLGLSISPGQLEGPPLAKAGHDFRYGAQKEGCHDRRFQQGLGSAVRRQTDLQSLVRGGVGSVLQLPRNGSSVPGLSILPARHKGTPCASMLRQQVRGIIYKSPGRPRLEAPLHAGERPSCMGLDQSALTEGDACAGQNEPRSRHVVKEQHLLRGMDAPPTLGSENLGSLWQSSSKPLRLQRQLALLNIFYREHEYPWPTSGPVFRTMLSLQSLCSRRYSGVSGSNGKSLF